MKVILADLGHNQLTFSSDVYPLCIANLATYTLANLEASTPLDITIVREPQDLKKLLDADPPDALGLSSFSWNHELSVHFAGYAKRRNPATLVLMGGPNYPLTPDVQESFLRGMPNVDIAVRGPTYEGERAFLNIIKRYGEVECRMEGVFDEPLSGSMWIDPKTRQFIDGGEVPRIEDLDEIPSPYLEGWLDPFLTTGYFPMMQISRGCPFSCQFCNSSVVQNNRIHAHSVENVIADLDYLAERIRPEITLCFADDNFGMYERDEEIADHIGYLQKRYGWPRYIRTTTGKNRADRIIRVMNKAGGALPMTSSVQSMNPEVLKNIQRSNIKLETYAKIQDELHAQGMQSYGELIICLPGETKTSLMKGIKDLIDSGVKRVLAHQLMLLHGAPLSNPESRREFGFKTQFRPVARNFGNYTGEPVVEIEEMVVSTPTFTFEEYLETRVFHLLLTIYFYEGNFDEAFAFAKERGIGGFDLVTQLQSHLYQAPTAFRAMIDDFVDENKTELHPSYDSCRQWAAEHFDELLDGTYGGNLISKYSMIGRFTIIHEALDYLRFVITTHLNATNKQNSNAMLNSVMDYLRSVMLHTPFERSLADTPRWTTDYDIQTWIDQDYKQPLDQYRFDETRTFDTYVPEDRAELIRTKVKTFGEHPSGLGKFTRTMFARDMRRSLLPAEARPESIQPAGTPA